jgi:hypothetical protein
LFAHVYVEYPGKKVMLEFRTVNTEKDGCKARERRCTYYCGYDPVGELRSEAAVAVEEVSFEDAFEGALSEGRDGCWVVFELLPGVCTAGGRRRGEVWTYCMW